MLASLLLSAAALVAPGGDDGVLPDFGAVQWWNSVPLTLGRLKGRSVFVESFRTW